MSLFVSIPNPPPASGRATAILEESSIRVLRNEVLFHPGERKMHLYRIEAGAIALYLNRVGHAADVVEFAFTGDVVGFGFLEHHIHLARAVGETHVRCLPLNALSHILRGDERAARRYAEALGREFEFRRDELAGADRKPVSRLAAFFLALSQLNRHEGRDRVGQPAAHQPSGPRRARRRSDYRRGVRTSCITLQVANS